LAVKCCGVWVLSQETDFLEQKVEKLGHEIIFYPKYNCELNFIENIWGWLKAHHSQTIPGLATVTIEDILPLSTIRKYSKSCFRFMDAYRRGLTVLVLEYAVKKYFRRRPASMIQGVKSTHV